MDSYTEYSLDRDGYVSSLQIKARINYFSYGSSFASANESSQYGVRPVITVSRGEIE